MTTTPTVQANSALPTPAPLVRARDRRVWGIRRRTWSALVKHVGLIALSMLMIYPLIWLVVSSLRPNDLIFRDPCIILQDLTFDNYV